MSTYQPTQSPILSHQYMYWKIHPWTKENTNQYRSIKTKSKVSGIANQIQEKGDNHSSIQEHSFTHANIEKQVDHSTYNDG